MLLLLLSRWFRWEKKQDDSDVVNLRTLFTVSIDRCSFLYLLFIDCCLKAKIPLWEFKALLQTSDNSFWSSLLQTFRWWYHKVLRMIPTSSYGHFPTALLLISLSLRRYSYIDTVIYIVYIYICISWIRIRVEAEKHRAASVTLK